MKKFLLYFITCLAKLGLRGPLLRKFAFRPPRFPTYTLRKRQQQNDLQISVIHDKKKSKNSYISHPRLSQVPKPSLAQDLPMGKTTSLENITPMIRIHRISSFITERENRVYTFRDNSDFDQLVYNKEASASFNSGPSQLKLASSNILPPKLYSSLEFKLIDRKRRVFDIENPEDLNIDAYYIETQNNNTIPVIYVQTTTVTSDHLIIYSHPNSTDLGLMLDTFLDLSFNLKINIIGYDYTGYGQSTGKATDINAIADIKAVYEFATKQLNFAWEKIILYGQSIGSGPSVTLASDYKYPVGGLILHSGFASGLRVICPDLKKTPYMDFFPNINLIQYVNCMVYILHGREDRMISSQTAVLLSEKVRNLYRIWLVEDGGHNNIEYENRFRNEYFHKLREFIRDIKQRNAFYQPSELLKLHRASKWDQNFDHLYNDIDRIRAKTMTKSLISQSSLQQNDPTAPQHSNQSNLSQMQMTQLTILLYHLGYFSRKLINLRSLLVCDFNQEICECLGLQSNLKLVLFFFVNQFYNSMPQKPFYLNHVTIKFRGIDHINHQYVHSGGDGLKIILYFGGVKIESQQIKYLQASEEIHLKFTLGVQSISASLIEVWLQTYRTERFIGAGQISLADCENQQSLNLSLDSTVMASVVFTIEVLKQDISKEIIIEDDNVILKKDDTEHLKQQAHEREKVVQQKRDQDEADALRKAQAKKPIIMVSSSNQNSETYL